MFRVVYYKGEGIGACLITKLSERSYQNARLSNWDTWLEGQSLWVSVLPQEL